MSETEFRSSPDEAKDRNFITALARGLDVLRCFRPNAWAAAPSRSAAGGTLLANDPHLEFSAPAIWYLARLELETGGGADIKND